MTFTEAAVEVLRRAGKPLHYKEIAESAVAGSLLSHVGQDPETTMGQRLAAMARREEERRVVAIAPDGTFALTEWSVPAELVVEAKPPPVLGDDGEKPYRPREREPRPIHSQARRRMEAIAAGEEPGEPEKRERPERQERGERGDRQDRHGDRKRSNVPAEAAFDWLAQRQSGAPIAEMAAELAAKGFITDALAHDVPSLTATLLEDNRRRTEAGRKPAFIVDGERVTLVEFPPPSSLAEVAHSPQTALGRPASAASLVAEGRRACVRALRSRLADLETAGFEHVCAALLEKMGMRDVRVAKRSKDGPLYLARQRWGVSDLRVAVRLVRGRREISRQDVVELRKDLAHYSAQMAILLSPGEAGREARTDASAAAQPPVALFAGEALAEELVEMRVGVTVEVVEVADVDEVFFAAARALKGGGRDARGPRDAQESRAGEGSSLGAAHGESSESDSTSSGPASSSSERAPEAKGDSVSASPSSESTASASAPVSPTGGAEPSAPEKRAGPDEARGGRRPRREREERPRMATPADQAWGQPAGTLKKSLELAALARPAGEAAAPAPASTPPAADGDAAASAESAPASPGTSTTEAPAHDAAQETSAAHESASATELAAAPAEPGASSSEPASAEPATEPSSA